MLSEPAMNETSTFRDAAGRAIAALRKEVLLIKAMSFAAVGVINATVDFCIFLLTLHFLIPTRAVSVAIAFVAARYGFAEQDVALVFANACAWIVAISGSYVMNSYFTFAAESGRKLRWRSYFTFAASGVLGWITNTVVVVLVSRFLPIALAKIVAIGAGFIVNFSMSHFFVFRQTGTAAR